MIDFRFADRLTHCLPFDMQRFRDVYGATHNPRDAVGRFYLTAMLAFDELPNCDPITAETMLKLEDAEQVVAVKWSFPTDEGYDQMREFAGTYNVIDNSGQQLRCHKNGGRGYVSAYVAVNPAHDIKVWELLEAKKYDEAKNIIRRVHDAFGPVRTKVTANSRGHLVKGMMEIIGRSAGPPRLPTGRISDEEMLELRKAMEKIDWM